MSFVEEVVMIFLGPSNGLQMNIVYRLCSLSLGRCKLNKLHTSESAWLRHEICRIGMIQCIARTLGNCDKTLNILFFLAQSINQSMFIHLNNPQDFQIDEG